MRSILATFFRILFKIPFFKSKHYGIYKRIISPNNLFRGITKKIKFQNVLLNLEINDWIQHNIYFLGDYENAELNFIKKHIKPDAVFIDIGANIGLYSLIISKSLTNKGKVIAFEPFLLNFKKLQKHIEINKANNIEIYNVAISNYIGNIEIRYHDCDKNLGMASSYIHEYTKTEQIKCTSIDEFLGNKTSVDFIKIDIEGGEYLALLGMLNILDKYHPSLLIEIDDEILALTYYSRMDIDSLLLNKGYLKHYFNESGNLTENISEAKSKNVLYQYFG